jgi:lipopolysaccharide/colanic/teichoic acid biosynthesis glycosyltransferase
MGMPVASQRPGKLESEIAQAFSAELPGWKRVLDLTCTLLSLPCWLTIMIGIALWIKSTSRGPILYRQERVGYRGKDFMMFKFRTMKVNVDTLCHEHHLERLIQTDCPMTKLDASGDPRIIRGGRVLRATGLDELPQLVNVLRGEMSLVGPRPCTPYEFQRYQTWQRERVNALPGLTGYWQVNGKNKTTFSEMVEMDTFYARNMSLRQDLAIMLRTVPAILIQLREGRNRTGARSGAGSSAV